MKRSWGMIPKVLEGRKKIESRWGKNRCAPWGRVKKGDAVYFKNGGGPVTARATITRIEEFDGLSPGEAEEILKKYGGDDGISVTNLENMIEWAKDKKYCTLIFLEDPVEITPFNIDKKGFGNGAAWITVADVDTIRIRG